MDTIVGTRTTTDVFAELAVTLTWCGAPRRTIYQFLWFVNADAAAAACAITGRGAAGIGLYRTLEDWNGFEQPPR